MPRMLTMIGAQSSDRGASDAIRLATRWSCSTYTPGSLGAKITCSKTAISVDTDYEAGGWMNVIDVIYIEHMPAASITLNVFIFY